MDKRSVGDVGDVALSMILAWSLPHCVWPLTMMSLGGFLVDPLYDV